MADPVRVRLHGRLVSLTAASTPRGGTSGVVSARFEIVGQPIPGVAERDAEHVTVLVTAREAEKWAIHIGQPIAIDVIAPPAADVDGGRHG